MGVSLDWNFATVRSGEAHKKYGDPYTLVLSVSKQGKDAYIFGASGKLTLSEYREFIILLKKHNIERVVWVRENGKILRRNIGENNG